MRVCVFHSVGSSSRRNSPTSGGSGGIGSGISKPSEPPIDQEEEEPARPSAATNCFQIFLCLIFIYISISCVFYCLFLCSFPGGSLQCVFGSVNNTWSIPWEHGRKKQEATSTFGGHPGSVE